MNDPSEHDDKDLTQSVRQFRRIARLVEVDPLRLLPADPLISLASLIAPATALIEVAPFECLRDVLAPAEPARRSDVSRAGVQHLGLSGAVKPLHAPAMTFDGTARSNGRGETRGFSVGRNAVTPSENEAPRREERVENARPATLAQRRAKLRRRMPERGVPSRRLSSVSAQTSAPRVPTPVSGPLSAGAGAPGAVERYAVTAAAQSSEALQTDRASADPSINRNAVLWALETEGIEASVDVADAASAAVVIPSSGSPFRVSAKTRAPRPAIPEIEALTRPREAPSGAHPDLSPAARAVELPAAMAARPRQSRNRDAGLELTEDLFEVLYRNGVDLSWP